MAAAYLGKLPKLIAHRGASAVAPENTLTALNKAVALGATWVESDVRLDSRQQPIIFHDARLHRTTNGRGRVSSTPYSVIRQLDAGSWFGRQFAGEVVPTLEQWLQHCGRLKVGINLELKASKRQAAVLADRVVTALARYWQRGLIAPIISSSSVDCLMAVHQQSTHFLLGYIAQQWPCYWYKVVERLGAISLHMDHRSLTPARVQQVKANDCLLLAYTVNDASRAEQLLAMGVDAIFSDDVELLS